MESLREEYHLELLLRVSGMSRSTYYHRLPSLHSKACLQGTDALIAEIFHESGREYDCRKVAAVLVRRGVSMNFKTVNRCKRYRRNGGDAGYAPNLLQQEFSVSASNSWPMVREMLERRWRVPEGMMIHSYQGVLYRCGEYLKFARRHRIVRSMSGKGSCYDNAVIESHFRNLKGWLGKLDRIPADKAVEMIDGAVRHFNEERILLKLGGLTPEEYLQESLKEHKCGLKVAASI